MPRYYFHLNGNRDLSDPDGHDLPGPAEARQEAIITAGTVLRDMREESWDGSEWRIVVADEAGATLFVVRVAADRA